MTGPTVRSLVAPSARGARGQEVVRRANRSAVLSHVHVAGPTSRAALTAKLALNRSTIGDLTAELVSLGLVTEEQPEEGAGRPARRTGRPSIVVRPRSDVTALAVALEVDRITVALVGLGGVVLRRSSRRHRPGQHDVHHVVDAVTRQVEELLEPGGYTRCVGVGVSVPGVVRRTDALVRLAPNLGWVDEPFSELLATALSMSVVADNDATLGVAAEHLRGAAVGVEDVAYVRSDVGIGGGIISGGQLLHGAQGGTGEVGHLLVDSSGLKCRCGATGCWETKVGVDRLLTSAGRLPGGGAHAVEEVLEAAAGGDDRCTEAVDEVAYWTGIGLANVVTAFDPRVIVMAGVLDQVWRARPDVVRDGLGHSSRIAILDSVEVRSAGLGEDSPLIGAAELALAPLLADPTGPPLEASG
jgi:predicted NBD/HSP70 family sugar kinase